MTITHPLTYRPSRFALSLLCWCLLCVSALAQRSLTGVVLDANTGERLPFINVVNVATGTTVKTDTRGRFSMSHTKGKLRFSGIGYETTTCAVPTATDTMLVKLPSIDRQLASAEVTGKRQKYSRKDNPAVQLMERVIAAKQGASVKRHPYFTAEKYTKMTFALNEVTDKVFDDNKFKRLPFLKEQVEVCNETGKLILPISVSETTSTLLYRQNPEAEKQIITGQRTNGLGDFFQTGDILTAMLRDVFADVDVYDESIRLFQHRFTSPIATHGAISFYRYFIVDTVQVNQRDRAIRVDFTPNNAQDFGFSGSLFILDDGTYRLAQTDLTIPKSSMVNFVDDLRIIQTYADLPGGTRAIVHDDLLVQLGLVDFLQKFFVKRTTHYSDYDFAPLTDAQFDNIKGDVYVQPESALRDEAYWQSKRPGELTRTEKSLPGFLQRVMQVKGFKPVLWVAKAFIENNVETTRSPERPSKVDIGPINTIFTHNFVDGFRVRASAQTTAHLMPHLFLRGYLAYGFADRKVKGMGEVTYAFNRKQYLPREFPVNNLTFNYTRDVLSPADRFLPTDKDNVFVSFKWTPVRHMMYFESYRLLWDREWLNGLRLQLQARTELDQPTAHLFYQPLALGPVSPAAQYHNPSLRTFDVQLSLRYQPGVQWVNTKQRRFATNSDAPIVQISHTAGLYRFASAPAAQPSAPTDYRPYHLTELLLYRRLWLDSWGKMNFTLKGAVEWNKVPYPLLIMPAANLSYVKQKDLFELVSNMEMLTDRSVALFFNWDLNGKIFNRIPLLRRLKWREYVGCNVLWGMLTDRNNPTLPANANDPYLLHFPGSFAANSTANSTAPALAYEPLTTVMNPRKPYVEVMAGIHNIFRFFHVEYVRRLNYLNPGTERRGVRIMFKMQF